MSEDARYPTGADGKPTALEAREEARDGRRFSPSISRNRDVLRDAFLSVTKRDARVLEIASGTGEHGAYILSAAAGMTWTYSDIDESNFESQRAWAGTVEASCFEGPYKIDTRNPHWGAVEDLPPFDALAAINMIHIAPFAAAEGLFAGAQRLLQEGGALFLYGPFAQAGEIAPSNARFDADLKRRDPAWGVRDLDRDIVPVASRNGLELSEVIEMPANNLSVVFRRRS